MSPRTKADVPEVSVDDAARLLVKHGVNFTDREIGLAQERKDGLGVSTAQALQSVLEERVGPAAGAFHDYPSVAGVLGVEDPVAVPEVTE